MIFNYQNAVKLLTSSGKFYINLGLERIEKILSLLNNPEKSFKIIHIAGTNGKGSVCALTAEILNCAGYKTGLYTSPHISEYTERIKINGENISENDFAQYVNLICEFADKNSIDLTEFEILTACAYKYFADKKVDFVLVETGLGGRFDATNAVQEKVICAITSISLDHTDRLGDTVDKIAFEKAGILRENTPVIINENNKGIETVKQTAKEKHSKVIIAKNNVEILFEDGINYLIFNNKKYEFSLLGEYQKYNCAIVFETVKYLNEIGYKITEDDIRNGLKNVKWAARLEYRREKNILIDGAHNPDAALELKKSLDLYFPGQEKCFIYATIDTKDYKKTAEILFNPDDEIYYFEFHHKNAVPFERYKKDVRRLKNVRKTDISELDEILKSDKLKIITGSFYMIGELYDKI